jgi:hypothetical protein
MVMSATIARITITVLGVIDTYGAFLEPNDRASTSPA